MMHDTVIMIIMLHNFQTETITILGHSTFWLNFQFFNWVYGTNRIGPMSIAVYSTLDAGQQDISGF